MNEAETRAEHAVAERNRIGFDLRGFSVHRYLVKLGIVQDRDAVRFAHHILRSR
jgi:hypothetical protein